MPLNKFLLQFTLAYVGLLVALALVSALFSFKSGSGGNTAALLGAVMWSCLRYSQSNKRYFSSTEKRSAFLGMLAIDVALQTLVAAAFIPWKSAGSATGALLFGILFVSALHAAVIWFFIGFAGKLSAKQVAANGG